MSVTFVLSLIQDVAVLAPLVRRAGGRDIAFLVADRLAALPAASTALADLAGTAPTTVFASTGEALRALAHRRGLVIFASESRSPYHRPTHALATALPSRFVSATLQHGYECIGFLHNRAHDRERADAGFAADIVCAWLAAERCTAVPAGERSKIMTTGATLFLDDAPAAWLDGVLRKEEPARRSRGTTLLVCENVQSVRLAGAPRAAFLDALAAVARERPVVLRPHPAGLFAKGELAPPSGVTLDARPVEEAELSRHRAAISAPSTVLFDLMRHDVPVAVWQDPHGIVDLDHYAGLPRVGPAPDWIAFDERADEAELLRDQRAFVRGLGFPADTRARFEALLDLGHDP